MFARIQLRQLKSLIRDINAEIKRIRIKLKINTTQLKTLIFRV
jgi:hypothetical protein